MLEIRANVRFVNHKFWGKQKGRYINDSVPFSANIYLEKYFLTLKNTTTSYYTTAAYIIGKQRRRLLATETYYHLLDFHSVSLLKSNGDNLSFLASVFKLESSSLWSTKSRFKSWNRDLYFVASEILELIVRDKFSYLQTGEII